MHITRQLPYLRIISTFHSLLYPSINSCNNFSTFFQQRDQQQLYEYTSKKYLHKMYHGITARWKKPYDRKQIRRQRMRIAHQKKQPIKNNDEKLVIHNNAVGIQYPAVVNKKFAVVKINGFQYKIMEDVELIIDRKPTHQINQTIIFDQVLLYGTNTYTLLGRPILNTVEVRGIIESMTDSQKILVFKKKRRKQYKKSYGSRIPITTCRIVSIEHTLTDEMRNKGISLI